MAEQADQQQPRRMGRRFWDHIYYWLPIVLSLLISGFSQWMESQRTVARLESRMLANELRMQGENKLIDYRLQQIEKRIDRQP